MAVDEKNFNFSQTDEGYTDASLKLHNNSEGSHPYLLERIAVAFEELANTVKQENGKGLSENDYSDTEKEKLAQVLEDLGGVCESVRALSSAVSGKVSKVDGMGLSHNDFTNLDKENLIAASRTAADNKIAIERHVGDKVVHITNDERQGWNLAVKQAKSAEESAHKAVGFGVVANTLGSGRDATVRKYEEDGRLMIEFGLPSGPAGSSPVKGVDYWTEEDKAELVKDVLAELPNGDEVSY